MLFHKFKIFWFKYVLSNIKVRGKYKINIPTLFIGKGSITFADGINLGYYPSPHFFSSYNHIEARNPNSKVNINSNTHINNNCTIIANIGKINIGKNCFIGTNFQCCNSDFHGIKIVDRNIENKIASGDINIEDNVFIGNNVVVLKNVTIGSGSVVGASSVITKSFPCNSIICGNPARLVRRIVQNEE